MPNKIRWLSRLAATCSLISLLFKPEAILATPAPQNEKTTRHVVAASEMQPLPAALAEFLYVFTRHEPRDQVKSLYKEWAGMSFAEREKNIAILYRAAHGGKEPPQLTYAKTKGMLARYFSNPALDEIIAQHERSVDLFYATWFPNNIDPKPTSGHPEYAVEAGVKPDGNASHVRRIWNWATQGGSVGGTSLAERAQICTSIRQRLKLLPPGEIEKTIPLDHLLIFTFRSESGWETRLYDRSVLPSVISDMLNIEDGEIINGIGRSWLLRRIPDKSSASSFVGSNCGRSLRHRQ